MSTDTGESVLSHTERKLLERAAHAARDQAATNYGIQQQPSNGNGNGQLYRIVLGICGFLAVVVLGIFGWVAVHVIEQQDDQSRRLATVEAKLDILLSNKNAKP